MKTSQVDSLQVLASLLLLVMVLLATGSSQAIIIRHDKSYTSYRAREYEFPAVFYLERQGGRKVCVATLIDSSWAITAAHCAYETSLSDTMASGELFTVSVAGGAHHIDRLVVHPDYRPGSATEVDLALIRFAGPLDLPAPLTLNTSPDEAGRTVSLLGWGFFGIGTTGRQYDDGQFRMAQNRIEVADRRLLIRFDDPRDPGADALELEGVPGLGDSGGPALLHAQGDWVLGGVAVGEIMGEDFSEETQGSYGAVAVYERVSRHIDWIRRTIETNNSSASE